MINLSDYDIDDSSWNEFKKLCLDIFIFIDEHENVLLYELMEQFPAESNPLFDLALDVLFKEGSIRNGSFGYETVILPSFDDSDKADDSWGIEERLDILRNIDCYYYGRLSQSPYYNPSDSVAEDVMLLKRSVRRTILKRCFVDLEDIELILSDTKSAERVLSKYCSEYPCDSTDLDLFERYCIPENIIQFVMNRSPAYCRLLMMTGEPGFGDLSLLLTSSDQYDVDIVVNMETREKKSFNKTILDTISYLMNGDVNPSSFVNAFLLIFEGSSYLRTDIIDIYNQFYNSESSSNYSDNVWHDAFDPYLCFDSHVRHIPYDVVEKVCTVLSDMRELDYGITVSKLLTLSKVDEYGIESETQLSSFIQRYTSFKIVGNRVLRQGTLDEAVKCFIGDIKNYEKRRILSQYTRRCGGVKEEISKIIDGIDMNDFDDGNCLTEDEYNMISERLKDYKWTTRVNARSIFEDLFGLGMKFTDKNMHDLGFTTLSDVYYRREYKGFKECLLDDDFSGDDVYVDGRIFKIKMESSAFAMQIDSFARSLHWIPVSENRYINLKSDRYSKFACVLSEYRRLVESMCKQRFMTPYLLKNEITGLEEIDDDDYDISFYQAILLSTGAKHQTINGQYFFHITSYSSEYRCIAPDFIRYIIYNNNGVASIREIQVILSDEYGIRADLSNIRSIVKQSSCTFSPPTDTAYLNDDYYEELLKNESE